MHKLPESLGEQILQALLERVTATLGSSFSLTRPELELAQNFVLERRVTGPLELLRYYRDHLTKNTYLDQLTRPDREWLLGKLASVLSFVQRSPSDQELLQTQWGLVAACPYLLEVACSFSASNLTDPAPVFDSYYDGKFCHHLCNIATNVLTGESCQFLTPI